MYSLIISDMTWSYSRISSFDSCPYKFFLTYIKPCPKSHMFFSDYGSFIHGLLASFYSGERSKQDIVNAYLTGFQTNVIGRAPDTKIFGNFFSQGLTFLKQVSAPKEQVLGVEKEVSFEVDGLPFTGFIDLILQDPNGDITIVDHKSRALKPRSTKGKVTKSDVELNEYLRQLYLYSVPVEQMFGKPPSYLAFNCYRTGEVIREPFIPEDFQAAKTWASESIKRITGTEDFAPNADYYRCKHLCDVHDSCEYYALQFQDSRTHHRG